MHRLIRLAAVAAIASAVLCATAAAHVTLQPKEVAAGAFERLDVRVPNERDNASTTKVEVRFPAGFIFASYEPVPGWTTKVAMVKLATPVEAFGEQRTEQVGTITFTATGKGIRPGQFQDFGLSLGLPDKAGTTLTFKSVQTYSNGEVVRWIGLPDADRPAPQVKLLAAAAEGASGGAAQARPAGTDDDESEDGDGNALAIVALVVGGLGLAAGGAALAASRRGAGSEA